jgi:MetJ family transcriptional regulator, methionine regulon repressor
MKKHPKDSTAKTKELSRKVAIAHRHEKSARRKAEAAKAALKKMRKTFKLAKKAAKESRRKFKALSEELHHLAKSAPRRVAKKKKAIRRAAKKSPAKKSAAPHPKPVKSGRPRKVAATPAVPAPEPAPVILTPEVIRAEDPGLAPPPLGFSPPSEPRAP